MDQEFSWIGKRMPRTGAIPCARGEAKYTVDLKLPGMLYGRILTSPHAHARIRAIDAAEAASLPGVVAVITIKDVPRVPYTTAAHPYPDATPKDQFIFDEKVRFVGDKVAAVAAVSEEIAAKALSLIKVDYEILPAVFDPVEAMQPGAPRIHDVGQNLVGKGDVTVGDVEKGFAEADLIVEDTFEVQMQQHCNLEPHVSLADFDVNTGRISVYSSTQVPFTLRRLLGMALDMPVGKIRIVEPPVGGGFGSKQEMVVEPVCAALALKARRPVMLELRRDEEFYTTRTRHAAILHLKSGVKKDGTFTARQMKTITNSGAYSSHGPVVTIYGGVMWAVLYRTPHMKFDGYTVYTNGPVGGAFRGYGVPQATFALESHVDNIAAKLGMDPLEFRLKNHIRAGDSDPVTGLRIEVSGLEECIRKGAKKIGWWDNRAPRGDTNGVKKRGVGMASLTYLSGAAPFVEEISSAIAKLNEDGTVTLSIGVGEAGQGAHTVMAMIAAEEIGVRPEDIIIVAGDTDVTPYDNGMFASRQTYVTGNAVKHASHQVREHLVRKGAEMLEAGPEDVNVRDRQVFVVGAPDRSLPVSDVARECLYNSKDGQQVIGSYSHFARKNSPPFGAQFAEVEVDTETGQLELLRLVCAHDIGRALNPMILEGQVEGGAMQGIGYGMMEELIIDQKSGQTLNSDLLNYKIPTCLDAPQIDTIFVETNDPDGPFGAKAIGEPPIIPTAPAIANAVFNAAGVRIPDLPITPEKVLAALKQKALAESM